MWKWYIKKQWLDNSITIGQDGHERIPDKAFPKPRVKTKLHSPLLPLTALRWLHIDRRLFDLVPVGAEGRASALDVALHHRAPGILVCISIELLEELVDGCIASDIWVLVAG